MVSLQTYLVLYRLTLKAPNKICSRWHLFLFSFNFFKENKKTSLDISKNINEKLKKKKKYFKMLSGAVVIGTLRVKTINLYVHM